MIFLFPRWDMLIPWRVFPPPFVSFHRASPARYYTTTSAPAVVAGLCWGIASATTCNFREEGATVSEMKWEKKSSHVGTLMEIICIYIYIYLVKLHIVYSECFHFDRIFAHISSKWSCIYIVNCQKNDSFSSGSVNVLAIFWLRCPTPCAMLDAIWPYRRSSCSPRILGLSLVTNGSLDIL